MSVCIFGFSSLFISESSFFLYFFLALLTLISSYFLIIDGNRESRFLYAGILLVSIFLVWFGFHIFFSPPIFLFFLLLLLASIGFFEYGSKLLIFRTHISFIRYCSLLFSLISVPFFLYFQTQYFGWSILALFGIIVFYFSIHVRYSNYVTYSLALLLIFYIYTLLFGSLLIAGGLFSVFLFIFFLPLLIIGNTYFWEQRESYDFIILHYSSIGFSVLTSLYTIFFLPWGNTIFLILFSCIFGIALLFFMSYFRFRNV